MTPQFAFDQLGCPASQLLDVHLPADVRLESLVAMLLARGTLEKDPRTGAAPEPI